MAEPVDATGELSVRYLLVAAVDGYLVGAPGLQVLVHDHARVVPFGYRNHLYHSSSGKASDHARLRFREVIGYLCPSVSASTHVPNMATPPLWLRFRSGCPDDKGVPHRGACLPDGTRSVRGGL